MNNPFADMTTAEFVELMTGEIMEDKGTQFAVEEVIIKWGEASRPNKQDENGNWYEDDSIFTSLEEANKALRARAWNAPQNGGYDKINFEVRFNDEEHNYAGRCDLQYNDRTGYTIQNQMKQFIKWMINNQGPRSMSGMSLDDLNQSLALYETL